MKIDSLTISPLEIPFKQNFKHASAERSKTQSVIVRAVAGNIEGLGEGCPREYVTNEDLASCLAFFSRNKERLLMINSYEDLKLWGEENKSKIDNNPAAWCAIELAILDLLSKIKNQSIESTLGLPELEGDYKYTAILGDANFETTTAQVKQFVNYGFTDFKIKITGDPIADNRKMAIIDDHLQENCRLRLDANNLWKTAADFLRYYNQLNYPIFAIEEPLQSGDFKELKKIIDGSELHVILDESFLYMSDFKKLSVSNRYIINLRISKMGGLIRSNQIALKAQSLKIPIIIGAQVGETSILTRSAISIANANRNNLIAQEGAFGTLLLTDDISKKPIMFGKGAVVNSANLVMNNNKGLGLEYKTDYNKV